MRLFAAFAAVALLSAAAPATLEVAVHDGAVRGGIAGGVAAFRGIPYAAPPLGGLRWQPPRPPARWSGVRDASAFGNYCAQDRSGAYYPARSAAEDCLYLNVFTTAGAVARRDHRPVMFWIPGGAFSGGSGNDYDMTALVNAGVVVVSINYRVGVLGFFALPALDAEHHALGDYGLMDQQLALRWVQSNIAAFGGDPHDVTIFGQSSGGGSVLSQLVSPEAANLFARAIVQSGSTQALARTLTPLATAEAAGARFATAAGCASVDIACLRALPAEQIVTLQQPYLIGLIGGVESLPSSFHTAIEAGDFQHVPVLLGGNHDDGRWVIAQTELNTGQPLTAYRFPAAVAAFYGNAAAPSVLGEYRPADYPSASEALGAAETDSYIACTSLALDRWLAPFVPVYGYEFDDRAAPMYMPPVSFPYGAPHSVELQFLFPGWHGGRGTVHSLSPDEDRLSAAMIGYWTAFAKTGDPNGAGRPRWPEFNTGASLLALHGPTPAALPVATFATNHHCDFWNTLARY